MAIQGRQGLNVSGERSCRFLSLICGADVRRKLLEQGRGRDAQPPERKQPHARKRRQEHCACAQPDADHAAHKRERRQHCLRASERPCPQRQISSDG